MYIYLYLVLVDNEEEDETGISPEIIDEIMKKMKYQGNQITLNEWSATYKKRSADMALINTSSDVVKFFEKWPLYFKKSEYVSNTI